MEGDPPLHCHSSLQDGHTSVLFPSLSLLSHLEVKGDDVNGDNCLPGKVLQSAGEECLREEEPGDPEHGGDT